MNKKKIPLNESLINAAKLMQKTDYNYQPIIQSIISQEHFSNLTYASLTSVAMSLQIAQNMRNDCDINSLVIASKVITQMHTSFLSNFNNIFSVYSDIASTELVNMMLRLPEHYLLIEEDDEINTSECYIKDTKTDNNIGTKELVSAFAIVEIFNIINEEEILEFYNYISIYPMLGLNHKVGKKILESLEEFNDSHDIDIHLFRGRIRKVNQKRPYTFNELFNAPYGVPNQGRFNNHGINFLYCNNSFQGAIDEIRPSKTDIIDIMEVKLSKKVKILDITNNNCALFNYCEFSSDNNQSLQPEYLVPNFLAQCCKLCNIDGIKYNSDAHEGSINYVFFNIGQNDFIYTKSYVFDSH